jgi:hypothetical protein
MIDEPFPLAAYRADTPNPMLEGMGQVTFTGAVVTVK